MWILLHILQSFQPVRCFSWYSGNTSNNVILRSTCILTESSYSPITADTPLIRSRAVNAASSSMTRAFKVSPQEPRPSGVLLSTEEPELKRIKPGLRCFTDFTQQHVEFLGSGAPDSLPQKWLTSLSHPAYVGGEVWAETNHSHLPAQHNTLSTSPDTAGETRLVLVLFIFKIKV